MANPELTEKKRVFDTLSGSWEGTEALRLNPDEAPSDCKATFVFNPIVQGGFLTADWVATAEGKPRMEGHGVIGFDVEKQQFTLHWFDNSGSPPSAPGLGRWENNALTFEHKYASHEGRTTFALAGDHLVFRVDMTVDGTWTTFVEGEHVRALAKPTRKTPRTKAAPHRETPHR